MIAHLFHLFDEDQILFLNFLGETFEA